MFSERSFELLTSHNQFENLSTPQIVCRNGYKHIFPENEIYVLRMMIKPKYGEFFIPDNLKFLTEMIYKTSIIDSSTFDNSWCYLTIRHGLVKSTKDDEFHFDGASTRFQSIPERNYIYCSGDKTTEYVEGSLKFPEDFSMQTHNLHAYAEKQVLDDKREIKQIDDDTVYMIDPFCLHRRPKVDENTKRTFVRISYTDVEIRDVNNTENPLITTNFYGRDGLQLNRNELLTP